MIFRRATEYVAKTNVQINKAARVDSLATLGLPDLRGFTPHLRTINVYSNKKQNIKSPWMTHDLCHIIFYDFVTAELGIDLWSDEARFYECHLASEAFAVLALDYHHLIKKKGASLTIDLLKTDWVKFKKKQTYLPDLESEDFCRELVQLYIEGESGLFSFLKSEVQSHKKMTQWFGHELSYSNKQRDYASLWFNDLEQTNKAPKRVSISGSQIHEAVWELLNLFLYSDEKSWAAYLKKYKNQKSRNYFSQLKKYTTQIKNPDFRFTDVCSLNKNIIENEIFILKKPTSSGLFLRWQLLAQTPMVKMSPKEKNQIKMLALMTQETNPDADKLVESWRGVTAICQRRLQKMQRQVKSEYIADFFLP